MLKVQNFHKILCSFAIIFLAGCTTFGGADRSIDYSQEQIIVLKEDAPSLKSFQSGRGTLNQLMTIGNSAEGSDAGVKIASTAPDIEAAILDALRAQGYQSENARSFVVTDSKKTDLQQWARLNGLTQGVIIDAVIDDWDILVHPKSREHFNLYLKATTSIYDIDDVQNHRSYSCKEYKNFTDPDIAPTRQDLMKDQRKLLKSYMSELTNQCAAASVEALF